MFIFVALALLAAVTRSNSRRVRVGALAVAGVLVALEGYVITIGIGAVAVAAAAYITGKDMLAARRRRQLGDSA
jgi:hypothetical protein